MDRQQKGEQVKRPIGQRRNMSSQGARRKPNQMASGRKSSACVSSAKQTQAKLAAAWAPPCEQSTLARSAAAGGTGVSAGGKRRGSRCLT